MCDNRPVTTPQRLYERLQADLFEARRRRDQNALNALSLLKSEAVKASKEPGARGLVDDELLVRVAGTELKKRKEAAEIYQKAGREEAARREEAEGRVLRHYLPPEISPEELEAEVAAVIAELNPQGKGALGAVMKAATERLAGRAQGGEIAAVAKRQLDAREEAAQPKEAKARPRRQS